MYHAIFINGEYRIFLPFSLSSSALPLQNSHGIRALKFLLAMAREFNQQVEVQHQPAHADPAVDPLVIDQSAGDANNTVNRSINDPNSPYYLHYGDNTGMQLIAIMLSEDNYTTWSRAVIIALSVKNKEGFIDGSITKPAENDLVYGAWRRCNHVVSSWIINSIPKELYPSVMHKDSARQIWIELKDRYSQGNGSQIYEIKKQIASISQDNNSINSYFNRFKGLWEELDNYRPEVSSADYKTEDQVMQFLMGLDD
ncbi:uncharacterized protein LOC111365732 [Olea europaea var. sylvestris]|uniref:uncharacterized protein LOC111365732 n=1 Tax=Olea europaea var. sylvestris TaxID=158386 RepID=UPI000C1CE0A4|nr:uncharacterized protein LOC111365732 [Olea europaea var. sylvestris]